MSLEGFVSNDHFHSKEVGNLASNINGFNFTFVVGFLYFRA